MTKFTCFLSGLAVLAAVACSNDDESQSSALPANKQLGDLSAEELGKLNEQGEAFTTQASASVPKEQACRTDGVLAASVSMIAAPSTGQTPTDSSLQQACSNAVTTCMQGSPSSFIPYEPITAQEVQGCTATVGELEVCAQERLAAATAAMANIPACDALTTSNVSTAARVTYVVPESCVTLATKCPSFAAAT